MARIKVELDTRQLREIDRRLNELPERITEGAKEAVAESGESIREQVERTVRVKTGRAKNAVRVRLTGKRGLTADVGWFDKDTYYMQFNEFGTSSIDADPVLTRAAEEERGKFPARLKQHIEDKL